MSDRQRKRILLVNAFFGERRRFAARIPTAMAPVYLAGAFSRQRCSVQIHNEQTDGPLLDPALLAWPDMLVLTGLTSNFDRMLHLTAYARTLNPGVVVVAGGAAIRALPLHAAGFFDYACTGDVEQLEDVVREVFGAEFLAAEPAPRFDLVRHSFGMAYAESSRNCNFRCGFCSLTGEGNAYRRYDLDYVRRQIVALNRPDTVVFIDNNFYGNNRGFFVERMALLKSLRRQGYLKGWCALVTSDFFARQNNVDLARDAGAVAIFSGVETFDTATLRVFNKRHNLSVAPHDAMRQCAEAGIVFLYGLIFDLSSQRVADVHQQLQYVANTPGMFVPSYCSLTIPLPGTPFFASTVAERKLLPGLKLRDLDDYTITLRTVDPLEQAVRLARSLQGMRGYRLGLCRQAARLAANPRYAFSATQRKLILANAAFLGLPAWVKAPGHLGRKRTRRTFVAGTEPLDRLYTPAMRVARDYAGHFRPTLVTATDGTLHESMRADYDDNGTRVRRAATPPVGAALAAISAGKNRA